MPLKEAAEYLAGLGVQAPSSVRAAAPVRRTLTREELLGHKDKIDEIKKDYEG